MTNITTESSTTDSRRVVLIAVSGVLCVAVAWFTTNERFHGSEPRGPYVWLDVAVVFFWSAMPSAWLLANSVSARQGRAIAALVAIVIFAANWNIDWPVQRWMQESAVPEIAILQRVVLALTVATAILLVARAFPLIGTQSLKLVPQSQRPPRMWLFCAAVVGLTIVPGVYLQSRCHYFQTKLSEHLSLFRLGQASHVASQLSEVAPDSMFNGVTLRQTELTLRTQVEQLEREVSQPLPGDCSAEQRIERARRLAMLDHVAAAHAMLNPLLQSQPPHPAACLLLGTAYESQEDWPKCLGWYERALESLARIGVNQQTRPAIVQAIKGTAFGLRKLGRRREAEAAYLQALELSPTADMHFLLAQFYEDGQQATKAQQHCLAAQQLDPQQFGASAKQLLDKLVSQHFGCMSVFWNRHGAPPRPAGRSLGQ